MREIERDLNDPRDWAFTRHMKPIKWLPNGKDNKPDGSGDGGDQEPPKPGLVNGDPHDHSHSHGGADHDAEQHTVEECGQSFGLPRILLVELVRAERGQSASHPARPDREEVQRGVEYERNAAPDAVLETVRFREKILGVGLDCDHH